MTAYAFKHGNLVYWGGDCWRYSDGERADHFRPCPRCGKLPDDQGRDACLGKLAGVSSACCGHGVETPYVIPAGAALT